MIDEAKNRAASANNSATNTMNKLNDIKKEIDKINISPVNSNLGKDLDDVEKSGERPIDRITTFYMMILKIKQLFLHNNVFLPLIFYFQSRT